MHDEQPYHKKSTMKIIFVYVVVLCLFIASSNGFQRSSWRRVESRPKSSSLVMSSSWKKHIAVFAATAALSTSFNLDSPAHSAPSPSIPLESAVVSLEKAEKRSETLDAMASVYEAASAKTLLARTRFKYRIVTALNDKRVKLSREWDQALGYANSELKRKVDPFRTVDLGPYLKVAPVVGGACYLGALFVQQALPEVFVLAYPFAVFVFAAPIVFIILTT